MRKVICVLAVLALLPVAAQASSISFFSACVDGTCEDLSSLITRTATGSSIDDTVTLSNGALLHITAEMDEDPFITFGATTTNVIPGVVTYAFLFGTPIVPGFYGIASASGGVTVSPGAANNTTVSTSPIYPTYISGYGTLGLAATNLGVDIGTASCSATTVNTTCNLGPATNTFAPAFYDNLEALLTYNQDDLGSVASWSGRIDLNPATTVPEPMSLTIVGLGVALVRAGRRRAAAAF